MIQLPDVEQLMVQALLGMSELSDFGGRIYTVVPKRRTFPLARISRFGGDPLWEGDPYWADHPNVQCDVWASSGGTVEAQGLGETLRACVAQRLPGSWPEGVVSSVKVTALIQTPDPTFDPPKPRYRFTATLIVHPAVTGRELAGVTGGKEKS